MVGATPTIRYTVAIPPTWTSDGAFLTAHSDTFAGFAVWVVGDVPTDPCHWSDHMSTPGPTVDDLTEAFTRQQQRNATEPVAIELAGYEGMLVEWSVPAELVVTGDSQFTGCDATPEGNHDFISWLGRDWGSRYQQMAGQMDRLWIIDVDGRRFVVDATLAPGASAELRVAQAAIAASIEFE